MIVKYSVHRCAFQEPLDIVGPSDSNYGVGFVRSVRVERLN